MKKIIIAAMMATVLNSCDKNDSKETAYQVDGNNSKVEWKGSAPDHFHVGSFDVSGTLKTSAGGKVQEGKFVIPISSIDCYDLQDPLKQVLLSDLKSENFFDIALYPTADFTIKKVEDYTGTVPDAIDGANYLLTGDFSMIGETHSISFPAKITTVKDSIKTEADFTIDRTQWGMNIYDDPNAELYILPEVNIHLDITSGKK